MANACDNYSVAMVISIFIPKPFHYIVCSCLVVEGGELKPGLPEARMSNYSFCGIKFIRNVVETLCGLLGNQFSSAMLWLNSGAI